MARLLIVHHARTDTVRSLTEAVAGGALTDADPAASGEAASAYELGGTIAALSGE